MNKVFLWIVKLTGLPFAGAYYRKKIYYENNDPSLRKIKGPALIISNHTSVYDFPLLMYTFLNRTIRTLAAEALYEYKSLGRLLKGLGGIKVDRKNYDFNFISTLSDCLQKGEVGLIFPESRLHTKKDPEGLLEFKPSYVYIALQNNVPIIPVYVNGIYGKKKKQMHDRARVMIGKPIALNLLLDPKKSEKDNILYLNRYIRDKIKALGILLEKKVKK